MSADSDYSERILAARKALATAEAAALNRMWAEAAKAATEAAQQADKAAVWFYREQYAMGTHDGT